MTLKQMKKMLSDMIINASEGRALQPIVSVPNQITFYELKEMDELDELIRQRDVLTERIEEIKGVHREQAVSTCRELVLKYDLIPIDLFPVQCRTNAGVKVAPKYRDPVTGKTWTGRGRAPQWVLDATDRQTLMI